VILYEMLSGQRAFRGNSAVETMNAILNHEPQPLADINGSVSRFDHITRHCLEKKPEQRFQSTSDLAFHLEALSGPSEPMGALAQGPSKLRKRLGWIGMAILFLAAVTFVIGHFRWTPTELRVFKFSALSPEKTVFVCHAVSPDGRRLAFTAIA